MTKAKIAGIVVAIAVAVGSALVLGVPVADAVKIAFDKDAAKEACAKLIAAE